MIQRVTNSNFIDAFRAMRPDRFTLAGLNALFNYLEEIEFDQEKQIEFNVVTICNDYTQYESLKEFNKDCHGDFEDMDEVNEGATLILIDNCDSFIITDF